MTGSDARWTTGVSPLAQMNSAMSPAWVLGMMGSAIIRSSPWWSDILHPLLIQIRLAVRLVPDARALVVLVSEFGQALAFLIHLFREFVLAVEVSAHDALAPLESEGLHGAQVRV